MKVLKDQHPNHQGIQNLNGMVQFYASRLPRGADLDLRRSIAFSLEHQNDPNPQERFREFTDAIQEVYITIATTCQSWQGRLMMISPTIRPMGCRVDRQDNQHADWPSITASSRLNLIICIPRSGALQPPAPTGPTQSEPAQPPGIYGRIEPENFATIASNLLRRHMQQKAMQDAYLAQQMSQLPVVRQSIPTTMDYVRI
ncbi:hypothetical protein B0H17DRAFT_1140130 [Mycena rosella]|uniref:Uncharacterized protein n=1 Tax=Mycena rosella TaxID=1033263 RepID=A0AAD7GAH8_MYCRO|nr:hypothetical protein B0H17DRAFT_1140130 [Mycena rosella]